MAFPSYQLYFDDLTVGQEWETPARTVTETDIVNFAGISGDYNPIHVDHEFAKTTPYRKPIAHGLLVFSIASGLAIHCPAMRTVAFTQVRDWNFLLPTFIGDTIHLRTRVNELNLKGRGRRGEVVWYRGVVNQDGKIVQEGEIMMLVECRPLTRPLDDSPAADATAL